MKLWFSLTLVCCALVCLFLSCTRVVGLNHPWQVVGSGPWLDRSRELASDAPTVSVVTSIECDSARAGPWQSLVLDGALTADHLALPGPGTHGPPKTDQALASYRSSRQLRPTPSSNLPHEITGFQAPNRRIGVLQQPLASQGRRPFVLVRGVNIGTMVII